MDNKDSIISLRNVRKVYGKRSSAFTALDGVNLEIKRGESVAVIGKSGSGKSTLMHILALLDKPTVGHVNVEGQNASKLRQRRINQIRNRKFGFVFQQFFMNSRDTVLNNVMLPLKIAGVPIRQRKKRALAALKIVDLNERAKARANDLSGGQKQRVCIARAIVNSPSVIFADEPTGNLDSVTGQKVEDLLFDLNKKGITLIIVTHDADLAAKCDRQIHIKDGKIEKDFASTPTPVKKPVAPIRRPAPIAKKGVK
ncbi:ABC transporter ATP-binding protein [Candidatus Saccharibacteria bacterium]|nr:ABC transporter ATP-binding protein [Candidatus Saccharibacteria bacterium]MCL1962963.1 ABC transporter ATP-binding protein [Candidatus Saccharibacteria bacterium]